MKVLCIECSLFSLQEAGEIGKHGMGECSEKKHQERPELRPVMSANYPRACTSFSRVEDARVITNRKTYLAQHSGARHVE